jgi:hypothetical protein
MAGKRFWGLKNWTDWENLRSAWNEKFSKKEVLLTNQSKREYLAHVWGIYQSASRELKSAILDEVARNLGIHRKSCIRLLNKRYPPRSLQGFVGGRPRQYSKQAKEFLEKLWGLMGYMGAKRMKVALPDWLGYYEHKNLSDGLRGELLQMSESSIHRFLSKARSMLRRRMQTGTYRGVKRFVAQVPVRNLDQKPMEPGHCEMDCVAHCGSSLSGEFAWTLSFTDIATGWTECEGIWAKDAVHVRRALEAIEARLPFRLLAVYCDNGSEFMNSLIVNKWAKNKDGSNRLMLYRGRPYKKNDQAYVEQKNYTHVRHLFGYGRIDWKKAVPMMNSVYRKEWRLLQNYFMPQQQTISKHRIGAKQKRQMDVPKTPLARLLEHAGNNVRYQMLEEKSSLNPFDLRHVQKCKTRHIFRYFKYGIHKNEWGKMAH